MGAEGLPYRWCGSLGQSKSNPEKTDRILKMHSGCVEQNDFTIDTYTYIDL